LCPIKCGLRLADETNTKLGHEWENRGDEMSNDRPIEIAAVAGILLVAGALFVWMIVLSDSIPTEYRSASPSHGEWQRTGVFPWSEIFLGSRSYGCQGGDASSSYTAIG